VSRLVPAGVEVVQTYSAIDVSRFRKCVQRQYAEPIRSSSLGACFDVV